MILYIYKTGYRLFGGVIKMAEMSLNENVVVCISSAEAIVELKKAGIHLDVKYPDQALRRLLQTGEIEGIPAPKNQPKLGWQVNEESLKFYIELQKMNPDELRKLVRNAKNMEKNLEQAQELAEKQAKKIKNLEKKLEKYEPAVAIDGEKPKRINKKRGATAAVIIEPIVSEITAEKPEEETEKTSE